MAVYVGFTRAETWLNRVSEKSFVAPFPQNAAAVVVGPGNPVEVSTSRCTPLALPSQVVRPHEYFCVQLNSGLRARCGVNLDCVVAAGGASRRWFAHLLNRCEPAPPESTVE